MTAIWHNDGGGWKLLAPAGYSAEAELHSMVEEAPHILPLAGSPRLVVVGREVRIGTGYADLVAIEPNGRLAIIEVKLANSAEARRAVVSQVLAYAAHLSGVETLEVEGQILATHLQRRGYTSLADAIRADDQEGTFDANAFEAGLRDTLAAGSFRLVLVLDTAPAELVRLVGYLGALTEGRLLIDLVAVSAYGVGGSQILVPQRVEAEPRKVAEPPTRLNPAVASGALLEGATEFLTAIEQAKESDRPLLRRLTDWVESLEQQKLAKIWTYRGKRNMLSLLPRLADEGVGLVTIYNDNGSGYLQFWSTVFERRAPNSLGEINAAIAPKGVGRGNTVRDVPDTLLDLLTKAYCEAVSAPLIPTELGTVSQASAVGSTDGIGLHHRDGVGEAAPTKPTATNPPG